jgi:hypothetical protein
MFPPLKRSFWKSLLSEAHDETVYITAGLSSYTMPTWEHGNHDQRIELIAFSKAPISGGEGGKEDIPTLLLQIIANQVLDQKIPIGVGHTLDFQEHLASNTLMSAFLFALADGVDAKRISRCTKAQTLLNVVPITAPEVQFARTNGVEALIERFEKAGVPPVFDYQRASTV